MRSVPVSLAIVIAVLGTCGAVHAEERRWHDEAEVTYVATSGNTEVTTLAGKNMLIFRFSEKTKGTWKLGALYGKSDGTKNAERYSTEIRGDRTHADRLYSFGYGGWLQDRFAGFDARCEPAPARRQWTPAGDGTGGFLLGEGGLTFNREEYTDDTDSDFLGGRVYGMYEYHFAEKTRFTQSLEWLPDFHESDNWKLNAETALLAALNSWLSLKTSYLVRYNNDPIGSLEKTDTILGASLVVNY